MYASISNLVGTSIERTATYEYALQCMTFSRRCKVVQKMIDHDEYTWLT